MRLKNAKRKHALKIIWSCCIIFFVLSGCKKDNPTLDDIPFYLKIPAGFPDMEIPADNQLTVKRVELGKMLFFDKALSVDSSVSCGSCHFQHLAFSDNKSFSTGVNGNLGIRNAPSLGNVGYHNRFFRDGGVPTLEQQILAPIEDPLEMAFSVPGVLQRMNQNQDYIALAKIAYDREPDAFVLTRAIAAFERTLITGNSKFDKYNYQEQPSALNESEKRGLTLFMSTETNCVICHQGFNFTDLTFRNNGLYEVYADTGRKRITQLEEDYGKFKVQSLRNVELTAPYMHDGSLNSLEEVIEHYNNGGKNNAYKDSLIKVLNLSDQQKQDLVNFLKTLTDNEFIRDESFLP